MADTAEHQSASAETLGDLRGILEGQPFFEGLAEGHMTLLAACASLCGYRAGTRILAEHDHADFFMVIRSGRVALQSHLPGRQRETFLTLGPGDVLGWSWLVSPHRWHYDARARNDVHVVRFDAGVLRQRMDHDPALGYAVFQRFTTLIVQRMQAARLQGLDIYAGQDEREQGGAHG